MKNRYANVIFTVLTFTMSFGVISCNQQGHTHKYSTEWSYDETHHWHAAICAHSDEKKDYGPHEFSDWVIGWFIWINGDNDLYLYTYKIN